MTSFYHNYFLLAPSPTTVTLGVRASPYEFWWGGTNQSIARRQCGKTANRHLAQPANSFWKDQPRKKQHTTNKGKVSSQRANQHSLTPILQPHSHPVSIFNGWMCMLYHGVPTITHISTVTPDSRFMVPTAQFSSLQREGLREVG